MSRIDDVFKPKGCFYVECFDSKGRLKWADTAHNRVVSVGIGYLLNAGILGVTQIDSWFMSLVNTGPTFAAGDTMGAHAGWTEFLVFSGSNRLGWEPTLQSSVSLTNSSAKVTFLITSDGQAVGGLFIAQNSTKNESSDLLFAGAAFDGGDKIGLDDGDTLNCVYTLTGSS